MAALITDGFTSDDTAWGDRSNHVAMKWMAGTPVAQSTITRNRLPAEPATIVDNVFCDTPLVMENNWTLPANSAFTGTCMRGGTSFNIHNTGKYYAIHTRIGSVDGQIIRDVNECISLVGSVTLSKVRTTNTDYAYTISSNDAHTFTITITAAGSATTIDIPSYFTVTGNCSNRHSINFSSDHMLCSRLMNMMFNKFNWLSIPEPNTIALVGVGTLAIHSARKFRVYE